MAEELRVAEVTFKDQRAGTIRETVTGGTRFAYAEGWTEQIASCLPPVAREHDWPIGLHPFFQHLGPEGWLREEQARSSHTSGDDDLGLLLRYGADCIGAVGVRPLERSSQPAAFSEEGPTPGKTLSGIQRKLLVVKAGATYTPARPDGPAPYIAKFNSEKRPTLVRNELRSLAWLADVLGKEEVTKFALGAVDGETALVVTRFDRSENGEKLRLEDFAQILVQPRGRAFEGKYDGSYETAASLVASHSALPIVDLERFFRRLVAYALVGNCDGHLKNFSLLESPRGLRLSPAYDVLNSVVYPELDNRFGLTIEGQRHDIERLDAPLFVRFGKAIGLPASAIDQTFNDLRRTVARANRKLQPSDSQTGDAFVTRYAEIVSNQCRRILGI